MLWQMVSAAGAADILVVSSSADVVECLLYFDAAMAERSAAVTVRMLCQLVSAAGAADILVVSSSADVVEFLLYFDAEMA